jgi:4-oxalocrotonate tautomerase
MPLVHIAMRRGRPPASRSEIAKAICKALHETFKAPVDDRFVTIREYDETDFIFTPDSFGVTRTNDLLVIEITVSRGRTVEQKKALYARIAALLESQNVRKDDIFITLTEIGREDWSFGGGLAQLI